MVIDVVNATSLEFGRPRALFGLRDGPNRGFGDSDFDISPDGQQVLALAPVGGEPKPSLSLIINWLALLKK